jgi:hypothetical protein
MKKGLIVAAAIFSCIAISAFSASQKIISSFAVPLLISYGGTGGTTAATALANLIGVPHVPDNATLLTESTANYPAGIWRDDYASGNGAPPIFYKASGGACSLNSEAGDNGSQVPSSNGKCWLAVFPSGMIDIREFGAKPDNATPADAAVVATNVYSAGIGACTYVPSIYPGFTFQNPITLSNSGTNCLRGDRLKSLLPLGGWIFSDLNFPNDTDGVIVYANNGWHVSGLSIHGHAATSSVPTHTKGLTLSNVVEGTVENVFLNNFAICREIDGSATFSLINVHCDDELAYPNITNDFPFTGEELANYNGSGATGAFQEKGGEIRAAAGGNDAFYTANGSTTWYQICPPGATSSTPATGTQLTCSGAPNYGVPLWRADGIKARVGTGTHYSNGQNVDDAPLMVCGVDYTIWDVSAAGGGGSGGTPLYCNQMSATLTENSTTVVVASTAGIPPGANILVTADHGLQLATKVSSITDSTHLVLSKTAYINGTVTLNITQIAIATAGPSGYSQACQATNSCGYKLEARFNSAPTNGTTIDLQWIDPTGYAAYVGDQVSDYVKLEPTLVGGYDVGLKHVGLSDGGIEFRPTYIELLNQCASVEKQTFGDILIFHRIINDPIPNCPGYVDSNAGPTIVAFNNVYQFLNGASN